MSIEGQNSEKENEKPQPIIWYIEQLPSYVDDKDCRKAIIKVINVVCP